MSNIKQIEEALHVNFKNQDDPKSRLIICVKRKIKDTDLDNGHFGLICAHSTGIAFNAWDGSNNENNWNSNGNDIVFNEKHTKEDFEKWRYFSFRKLVLAVESDKDFENIKSKLVRDEIPFKICGEIAFGNEEVAIVVFPLTKENTPKCLSFLKVWN